MVLIESNHVFVNDAKARCIAKNRDNQKLVLRMR